MDFVKTIMFALFVIVLLLLSPIWLPYALISSSLELRRRQRIAKRARCEGCGSILGSAALDLSRKLSSDAYRRAQAEFPDCLINARATHHAICPSCGKRYLFDRDSTQLLPTSEEFTAN